ncbi:MAG: putative unusual protein kinase regulating ubiquinone biosynthesis (AarF/ABC1/UbiB family) [Chlamydiales bacterium]|jgi:predicted unusual protein kinase regulating ubiquinone biosynthesis (AarF/ABC1/UbiB family)
MKKTVVSTSKLKRVAGMAQAGLGARGLRSDAPQDVRQKAALHVAQRLGRLRGLPQKMGQILSMADDAEVASAFGSLGADAEPVSFDQLRPVIESAWGHAAEERLAEIDPAGHAASLGQVHHARLLDGSEVAIKVQYPGIDKAIDADLKMLGWISEPLGGLKRGFELPAYRETIRAGLAEELDYEQEADNQRQYARCAAGPGLIVPEVVDELSSKRVLVTRWEDGVTLQEARTWEPEQRAALARTLVEHFLVMLFEHGLVHADPHPGNYRFRQTPDGPRVVLYDFGSVHRVPDKERLALLRLIHDTFNTPDCDPYPLFIQLGFGAETLEPLRHRLPALCHVLFAPFGSKGAFDIAGWDRSEKVSDILGDDRWNFRISGPARLLFLMRAFHGLVFYLRELDAPVRWSKYSQPHVEREADAMRKLVLPVEADTQTTFATLAEHLLIRVTDDGKVKVQLSLPANAVERIDSLLAEDVRQRIDERGIKLPELLKRVRSNQYAPQELFRLEEGTKVIEVWLA